MERRSRQVEVWMLLVLVTAAGCSGLAGPSPMYANVADLKYEHVISPPISPDMNLTLVLVDCNARPMDGPTECPLTADSDNVYRCHDQQTLGYLSHLAINCANDYTIYVEIRTSSGNWIAQVAHDIYLNGTKVTRISPAVVPPVRPYPEEFGRFRIDQAGHIY